MKKIVTLVALLLGPQFLGACHGPPQTPSVLDCPAQKTPSCEISLSYALDTRFTPPQKQAFINAMYSWVQGTNGRVCLYLSPKPDVYVVRAETNADLKPFDLLWYNHVGLYVKDITGTFIWIVTANHDQNYLTATARHEIGHSLSLHHTSEDIESVMHPAIDRYSESGRIYPSDLVQLCKEHSCKCNGQQKVFNE